MVRQAFRGSFIVIELLLLGSGTIAAAQEKPGLGFKGLITAAEAIVAVEILSTDYTATPADGPMVATAKVLKALKGPVNTRQQFSFTETAWVGPTYQKGECRILFLEKAGPAESRKAARWRILSNLYARTDFFIEKDSLAALSNETLESFLETLGESKPRPKNVVFDKK